MRDASSFRFPVVVDAKQRGHRLRCESWTGNLCCSSPSIFSLPPVRVDETLITLPLLLNSSCPEKNRRQRTRNPRRYFCTRDRYSTNLISHRDGIRCVFRPNNGVAITKIAIHTRKHTFRSRDSPIRTIREYEEGKGSSRSRHRVIYRLYIS